MINKSKEKKKKKGNLNLRIEHGSKKWLGSEYLVSLSVYTMQS